MTEDQKLKFENQGFLHLKGILEPDLVKRVRTAFTAAEEKYTPEWRRQVAAGQADERYCDIPDILDVDSCFVDLVDHPTLLPVLVGAVGPDVQLNHTHARIFPPGKTFTAAWHSDLKEVLGIDLAHSPNFFVKVHFYFEDLLPNQGCLGFIPGTHRLPTTAPRPRIEDPDKSVSAVKIVPKAGDVVLFNTHILHMALDNASGLPRRSLIYAYSHFWVKHYANAVPKAIDRYATTKIRKQLFGVEEEGVPYFNQRYDESVNSTVYTSFESASRRLLNRIIKATSVQK